VTGENLELISETCIEDILETLAKNKTDILVVDSISVLHSKNISGVS
jgi:predicted ATP-dependent serine protease